MNHPNMALAPSLGPKDPPLQTGMNTSLKFARLLNEARMLLDMIRCGQSLENVTPSIDGLEARCRDAVGPIIYR